MNRLDFDGQVAVISGGGTGIGLAVAQRLKASGGRVSLWDRDASALEQAAATLGQGADVRKVDVADAGGVAAAAQATAAAWDGSMPSSARPGSPGRTRRPGSTRSMPGAR
jgi:3-oxoacyl-[acyl-carrier protein] reductase